MESFFFSVRKKHAVVMSRRNVDCYNSWYDGIFASRRFGFIGQRETRDPVFFFDLGLISRVGYVGEHICIYEMLREIVTVLAEQINVYIEHDA